MTTRIIQFAFAMSLIGCTQLQAANQAVIPAKFEVVLNKDIIEVLKADGHYTILLKNLEAAQMTGMLRKGTFTVFAPTDEAFRKMLILPGLQQTPTLLFTILKNHVVPNHIYASTEIAKLKSVKMMSGETMDINSANGKWLINGARIVQADMTANNGIIHGIDAVLTHAKATILNGEDSPRLPEPGEFLSENR